MYNQLKTTIQIFITFLLFTIMVTFLFFIIKANVQPLTVAAQEPLADKRSFTQKILPGLDFAADAMQTFAGVTSDLEVVQNTNVITVLSGSLVTFTVLITNHGPDVITDTHFYDDFPSQLEDITYHFSVSATLHNHLNPTQWSFDDPLPVDSTVFVTITGRLTSALDVTVVNTVAAYPPLDSDVTNNESAVQIDIEGYNPIRVFYLPLIVKSPPEPTVFYSDYFTDNDSGWYDGDDGSCDSQYRNGQYKIDLESSNRSCLRFAPSAAEKVYGQFVVSAYHSEGNSDAAYGFYFNGTGGDNYYYFRIWPNNDCNNDGGDWELIKRKDGKSFRVVSGDCFSAINRGFGSGAANILKTIHTTDGKIALYINNNYLHTYSDTSQLTGDGLGVYARSDNVDIAIKYDYFIVYNNP